MLLLSVLFVLFPLLLLSVLFVLFPVLLLSVLFVLFPVLLLSVMPSTATPAATLRLLLLPTLLLINIKRKETAASEEGKPLYWKAHAPEVSHSCFITATVT